MNTDPMPGVGAQAWACFSRLLTSDDYLIFTGWSECSQELDQSEKKPSQAMTRR